MKRYLRVTLQKLPRNRSHQKSMHSTFPLGLSDLITLGKHGEINWSKSLTFQIHQYYGGDDGNRLFSVPLGLMCKFIVCLFYCK